MIVKIRSKEQNGWIYLDKVKSITTSHNWAITNDAEPNILFKVTEKLPEAMTRDQAEGLNDQNAPRELGLNRSCLFVYDFDVEGDLFYSTDTTVYPLLLLQIWYESGNHESYIMMPNNDVFLINDQGKTIERIS